MQNNKKFFIATFYKCFSFEQIQLLENLLKRQFKKLKIVGTVILTSEGINSTIASQNLVSLKNKMVHLHDNKHQVQKLNQYFYIP